MQQVKLEHAYMKAGQLAQVRIGEELLTGVACASPPFSEEVNAPVLYKIRGDIPAGTTKLPQYSLAAKAPIDLHVTEADSASLYNLKAGTNLATHGIDSWMFKSVVCVQRLVVRF